MSNAEWFRYEWVWDKAHPTGFASAKRRPLKRHDSVLVFSSQPPRYYPQMFKGRLRNKRPVRTNGECYRAVPHRGALVNDDYYPQSIVRFSNANQRAKIHPTQKPVALMEYLIRTYTTEGELVLDNTMGSGTTGVACIATNRRFIGIEKDREIFQMAKERIKAEYARTSLLDGVAVA